MTHDDDRCPTCGVGPNEPCMTPKGRDTADHVARVRAAAVRAVKVSEGASR